MNFNIEKLDKVTFGQIFKLTFLFAVVGIVLYLVVWPFIAPMMSQNLLAIVVLAAGAAIVLSFRQQLVSSANSTVVMPGSSESVQNHTESKEEAQNIENDSRPVVTVPSQAHEQMQPQAQSTATHFVLPKEVVYIVATAALCFFLFGSQGGSRSNDQVAASNLANNQSQMMQLTPTPLPTVAPTPTPSPTPEVEKKEEAKPSLFDDIMKQIWKHAWGD
ncbi:MAG: hypothetical protein R3B41_02690 [Candidatus Doudnabacteria bacterium]